MLPPLPGRFACVKGLILLALISAFRSGAGERDHWAFIPPRKAEIAHASHPIDSFLHAKYKELGLRVAPEADRRTLIRRLCLDVTGLPPTPAEVEAFAADSDPRAYDRLVTRLLASPRYGERWGRFWLDLARWAESDGYEANEVRATAWRYRDYVVRAFNEDRPYDRFLREQIAGDELEPYADENIIATGFLAAARSNNNEEDKAVQLNEPLVDIANTTASVTLGLTLACAQCHDHKFEPLSIRDYYSWHGLFARGQVNSLALKDAKLSAAWKKSHPPELQTAKTLLSQLTTVARAKLKAENTSEPSEDALRKALNDDDQKLFAELKKKIAALEKKLLETRPQTWSYYSPATSPHAVEHLPPRGMFPFPYKPEALKELKTAILKRGNVANRGETVEPGAPAVLGGANFKSRSDMVDWLASASNPLTARVWVNYVWQQHFGRGLVETPGDFGVKGAKPVNKPLLDWLAVEFRERGWSTKHLHRLILTSAAYRRAALDIPDNSIRDPDNRHLWRWTPRRLESEAVRDSLLAVAGQIDLRGGGPSDTLANASQRRSIYLLQRRFNLPEHQSLFDAPTANESCPRRHSSTTPLQPLHLLNSEENVKLAGKFAEHVRSVGGPEHAQQIRAAFCIALSREPDTIERQAADLFFAQHSNPLQSALADFCQSIMNLNEFHFIP